MSTRAQIGFYESKEQKINKPEVLIYKHSDGYPEGVVELLTDFCTKFAKSRGLNDTEYAGAWYLHSLIAESVKNYGEDRFLGYGICKAFHGDIEYFYRVHPNEILIYEAPFWEKTGRIYTDSNDQLKNYLTLQADRRANRYKNTAFLILRSGA